MIFKFKKIFISSMVVIGTGGIVSFIGNEFSKTKISENLGNVKLLSSPFEANKRNIWSALFLKIYEEKNVKTKKFQDVIDGINPEKDFEANLSKGSENLKKACEESKNEVHSSWFSKNDDLLEEVKEVCSLKMSYLLKIFRPFDFSGSNPKDSEKDLFKGKLDSLKNNQNITDSNLSQLKSKITTGEDTEHINTLFNWCKSNMSSYYEKENEKPIDLLINYCTKGAK